MDAEEQSPAAPAPLNEIHWKFRKRARAAREERDAPGAADDVAHKRPKLPHVSNVTKSGLVRILLRLQETGRFLTDASGRQLRRQANNTDIGQIETPYGKLLQCMDCGASKHVDVAHPAALLTHLSSINVAFANAMMVMADAAGSDPSKLIIYSDGLASERFSGQTQAEGCLPYI